LYCVDQCEQTTQAGSEPFTSHFVAIRVPGFQSLKIRCFNLLEGLLMEGFSTNCREKTATMLFSSWKFVMTLNGSNAYRILF
jgi:hypothetical protein